MKYYPLKLYRIYIYNTDLQLTIHVHNPYEKSKQEKLGHIINFLLCPKITSLKKGLVKTHWLGRRGFPADLSLAAQARL